MPPPRSAFAPAQNTIAKPHRPSRQPVLAPRPERVEHECLLLAGLSPLRKTPLQTLIVRRASQYSLHDRGIFDVQESANPQVSARAVLVIRRQLALSVQSDLIQHPAEKDYPANLLVRAS